MAKVTFPSDIQAISGRLCSKEGIIYSVNQKTGKTYRSDRHKENTSNTAKQQAVKATFKTRMTAAKEWWNNNKPLIAADGTVTREGTEDYNKLKKLYNAQYKIGNIYTFFCTYVQDDGTVTIGTKRVKGGVTTTPEDDGGL